MKATYSGAGTVEFIMARAKDLLKQKDAAASDHWHFWAAIDMDPLCRSLTLASDLCPEHVFGNIEERIPVEMLEYCRIAAKALEDRAQEQIKESKESKALAFQEFGQRIRAKSTKILVKFLRA